MPGVDRQPGTAHGVTGKLPFQPRAAVVGEAFDRVHRVLLTGAQGDKTGVHRTDPAVGAQAIGIAFVAVIAGLGIEQEILRVRRSKQWRGKFTALNRRLVFHEVSDPQRLQFPLAHRLRKAHHGHGDAAVFEQRRQTVAIVQRVDLIEHTQFIRAAPDHLLPAHCHLSVTQRMADVEVPPIGVETVFVACPFAVRIVAVVARVVTHAALGLVVTALPVVFQVGFEIHGFLRDLVVAVQTHGRGHADFTVGVIGLQISDGKFGHRGGRSHARPYRTHDVTVVKSRHRYIPNPTPPSITRLCAVTPPASGLAR
ncbi:hypothetical protein D3C81_1006240 [compost metagenome]